MAFCTPAELIDRIDNRRLQQLLSYDGTPVALTDLASNTRLETLIDDASAIIMTAALVGKRYSQAMLQAVADDADPLISNAIIRLTVDVTGGLLVGTRIYPEGESDELVARAREAAKTIELLRRGERVFAIDEVEEAGVRVEALTPSVTVLSNSVSQYGIRFFGQNPYTAPYPYGRMD